VLRGAANGAGVSYNALANDLENVNYSSIRAGVQEDQAHWKTLQQFMITRFLLSGLSKLVEDGNNDGSNQSSNE
jgi:capsid protein